jgi:hypothetical protein
VVVPKSGNAACSVVSVDLPAVEAHAASTSVLSTSINHKQRISGSPVIP